MAVESHEHAVSKGVLTLMEAARDILLAEDLGLPPDHVDWKSATIVLRRAMEALEVERVDRPTTKEVVR